MRARLLAALFVALSPVLPYSQEARMYAIVTLLAMSSIYFLRLTRSDYGLMRFYSCL